MSLKSKLMRASAMGTCTLILATFAPMVAAQEPVTTTPVAVASGGESAGAIFERDFFDQYAPRSALDMVNNVPGFQIRFGASRRGLGQGGTNILINGDRAAGKSDITDQLSRISAKNVVRIEIKDGASLDIPGLSGQVANVITKPSAFSGTWEFQPEFRDRLQARYFTGEISVSGESDNFSYSAAIKSNPNRNGNKGPRTLRDAMGNIFEIREENAEFSGDRVGLSGDLKWTPKDSHTGNLNLEYNRIDFREITTADRIAITASGDDRDTVFTFGEDEWNASISADYEHPFLDGSLKTTGYYRAEHSPTNSRFKIFDTTGLVLFDQFNRIADEGEAILRSEYSFKRGEKYDWQLGLEGAFNFLDIESEFLDGTNPPVLDADRIEEQRAELTLTRSWPASDKLDMQASVGGEYSQLSQASGAVRDFFRPKGFLSATYKAENNLNIRGKIEREVGQLNFFDFASSIDLVNGQNTSANTTLVPSQTWNGELEFDKDFGDGNTLKILFYGNLISDRVGRIPIGVNGDGIGNIDSAHNYGIDINATIKGERWGLKGMELELELDGRQSAIEDPLTEETRRISGDKITYWFARFRHDIPDTDWAWGVAIDRYRESKQYRLTSISHFNFPTPFLWGFIEHKDVFGLKVNVAVLNWLDSTDEFSRTFFTARRDIGVIDYTEFSDRDFNPYWRFTVSGTF